MTEQKRKENIRPPVVVVMGHVDHGKTTLLDYIRKFSHQARVSSGGDSRSVAEREAGLPRPVYFRPVAESEAGGITQAVGAYEILHNSRKITFIDTPGHEAFVSMRSRGAAIADLAVLVVAADEGVKPQTKEAIGILEKTKTPFVVAITKIDKNNADVNRAKNELAAAGVLLEGHGGQVSYHGVSAKTGEGVSDFLDLILLVADVEHLTYDVSAPVSGYVLEARMDKRRGIEASVIVQNGTLRKGDIIRTPTAAGRVKILEDFLGEPVAELVPSAPARIIGLETLPKVGEEFSVGEAAPTGAGIEKGKKTALQSAVPATAPAGTTALKLILKASDAGSLEALALVMRNMKAPEGGIAVFGESVGDVTDGDVKDAIVAGTIIIGFKSRVEKSARNLAEARGIRIITSEIIYDLVKVVEEFLSGVGKPVATGALEVLAVFNQSKLHKQLVGGRVVEGVFKNKGLFEVKRVEGGAEKTIGSGKVLSLRDKKNDIQQAEGGKEAGALVDSGILIKVGDRLVMQGKR